MMFPLPSGERARARGALRIEPISPDPAPPSPGRGAGDRRHVDDSRGVPLGRGRHRGECRPRGGAGHGGEHRRPPHPGRLALSLLRGQPRPGLRPGGRLRPAAQCPGRHGGALRARRREARRAGRAGGTAGGVRPQRPHRGPALRGAPRRASAPRRGARASGAAPREPAHPAPAVRGPLRTHGGGPRAPGRHRAARRGRARPHRLRRRGQVRRRQGDPRWHGAARRAPRRAEGALDCVITNALVVDHWGIVKADIGIRGGRVAGDRQGRQPRHHGRGHRGHGDRGRHRGHRRRGAHRHRGRDRRSRPPDLPPARGGGPRRRAHHPDRGRDRTGHGHQRHHVHAGGLEHPPDARGGRGAPDQPRLPRQGQLLAARAPARAGGGGGDRAQAPRGLGDDAGRHRRLPRRGRGDGHPGRHSHRHPERGRLRRGLHPRLQGADDPHLPHRGRGRRPRPRHHQGVRRAELPAVFHQSRACPSR